MTREQIESIERLYIERSDSLDASSYSIPELCKDALEALEYFASDECVDVKMIIANRKYKVVISDSEEGNLVGEGETPLEAINNARRGM